MATISYLQMGREIVRSQRGREFASVADAIKGSTPDVQLVALMAYMASEVASMGRDIEMIRRLAFETDARRFTSERKRKAAARKRKKLKALEASR